MNLLALVGGATVVVGAESVTIALLVNSITISNPCGAIVVCWSCGGGEGSRGIVGVVRVGVAVTMGTDPVNIGSGGINKGSDDRDCILDPIDEVRGGKECSSLLLSNMLLPHPLLLGNRSSPASMLPEWESGSASKSVSGGGCFTIVVSSGLFSQSKLLTVEEPVVVVGSSFSSSSSSESIQEVGVSPLATPNDWAEPETLKSSSFRSSSKNNWAESMNIIMALPW